LFFGVGLAGLGLGLLELGLGLSLGDFDFAFGLDLAHGSASSGVVPIADSSDVVVIDVVNLGGWLVASWFGAVTASHGEGVGS
jgi:hypothetical protein